MMTMQPINPAEMYEQYFVPAMFRPWAEILLRHAGPLLGKRVLDVACGTGIVARLAAPRVGTQGEVAALDMNSEMLNVGRGQPAPDGAAIGWREGSAMALPYSDARFDIVVCQHGLQFFPDRIAALREMLRVAAPGGRVLVMVLQKLEQHSVFEALMSSVAHHLSIPLAETSTPFALHDPEELRSLFSAAGCSSLEVREESTIVRFPDPLRFVPLAVISSAAAIPSFTQLTSPERAALLEAVRQESESTIAKYRFNDVVTFPMFAHIVVATV